MSVIHHYQTPGSHHQGSHGVDPAEKSSSASKLRVLATRLRLTTHLLCRNVILYVALHTHKPLMIFIHDVVVSARAISLFIMN